MCAHVHRNMLSQIVYCCSHVSKEMWVRETIKIRTLIPNEMLCDYIRRSTSHRIYFVYNRWANDWVFDIVNIDIEMVFEKNRMMGARARTDVKLIADWPVDCIVAVEIGDGAAHDSFTLICTKLHRKLRWNGHFEVSTRAILSTVKLKVDQFK